MPCIYTNRKGRVIEVTVSEHALRRYMQRREMRYEVAITQAEALLFIEHAFNRAERTLTSSYRNRCRKYKGESLYFKSDGFVFVVENGTIVTVEIASKKQRHLN
jgi:serine/threonine protein phosphatase PrpC